MTEIIIIILLLLVLFISVGYKNNYRSNNYKNILNNFGNIKENKLNLINRKKGSAMRRTKYDYYTKKKVRFADNPSYLDCPSKYELKDEDKFIDEYVFNSKIHCHNSPPANKTNLSEYRRDFFEFRNKTNQIANNYSPVDRINEMIVSNPDLSGEKISDIYDALTSNDFNTSYTKINMPNGMDKIKYIDGNNSNSTFASY